MVKPEEICWDELGFSLTPTEFMYIAHCGADQVWQSGKLEPFGNLSISPAACVLNYGQGLFEGLKAYRSQDGKNISLFRPEQNAQRIHEGCKRICIPPLPTQLFLEAVTMVVEGNKDYVPPYKEGSFSQGALYIRPVVLGTGPMIGVAPAPSYTFVIYVTPVGPYFKKGFEPIKLKIETEFHRASRGGTGGTKAIGNYSVGMLPGQQAKKEGFNEVLYLDSAEGKYIEEVGAANFFCIKNNTLMTPHLDGCILPGITRKSLLHLAKERFSMEVKETKISVEELLQAEEAFGSGTGAVITPVGSVNYKGQEHTFNEGKVGKLTRQFYKTLLDIQHQVTADEYGWVYKVV